MSKVITFIFFPLLAIVAVFLILYAPQLLLPDNVQQFDSKEVASLQMEAHKHMAQIIGGIAVLFALYLIYRRIIALEKNIAIAQEAQLTDRFTRAIEQLGTYKLEVQLGGISL